MAHNTFGSGRRGDAKELVTQGLVTFNVDASTSVAEFRKQLASTSTDLSKYWGRGLTPKGTDGDRTLHVLPWQLLLTYKRGPTDVIKKLMKNRQARNMANIRVPVFSTFNMYPRTPTEQVYREITALGFSANYHVFGEPTQVDGGLACVVSGSFSTTNTGISGWAPGMLIKWSPPPADPAELQRFEKQRENANAITAEYPKGYYPAILEPFNFDYDIRQYVQRRIAPWIAKLHTDAAAAANMLDFRRLDLHKATDPDEEFFMQLLRADILRMAPALGSLMPTGSTDRVALAKLLFPAPGAGAPTLSRQEKQAAEDYFVIMCQAIHDVSSRTVGKSIDFCLPSGKGGLVL